MSMSSMSAMRRSTIGRSPEMPCGHKPDCAPAPRRMVSDDGRSRRRGVNHVPGEPLKQARFAGGDRRDDAIAPAPASRPASRRARRRSRRDACRRYRAAPRGWRDDRPERHANGRARRNANTPADREDRIEHSPDGVRERPAVDNGDRRADAVAATEEPRPVGLKFRRAHGLAVDDGQMRGPDFRLGRRSPAPRRQNGADIGEIFGFDEQLREGRMRDVGALRRQNEFGVGGDFDLACDDFRNW